MPSFENVSNPCWSKSEHARERKPQAQNLMLIFEGAREMQTHFLHLL